MMSLHGRDFVQAFMGLTEYVIPKLARREITGDLATTTRHVIELDITGGNSDE